MTLLHFNYLKRSMLEKLPSTTAAIAEARIDITLKILNQETLSAEALAILIALSTPSE